MGTNPTPLFFDENVMNDIVDDRCVPFRGLQKALQTLDVDDKAIGEMKRLTQLCLPHKVMQNLIQKLENEHGLVVRCKSIVPHFSRLSHARICELALNANSSLERGGIDVDLFIEIMYWMKHQAILFKQINVADVPQTECLRLLFGDGYDNARVWLAIASYLFHVFVD